MDRPKGITVNQHLLNLQREHPDATGELTGLLSELIIAGKIISAEVNMAGLADVLGMSGKTNVQGEEVQKLDDYTNETIKRRIESCGHICVMASEEEDGFIPVNSTNGKYTLSFDPLDGSSNIDVNVSIGTIFSIHKRISPIESGSGDEKDLLQRGSKQVAAGYIIYGSSTMLVFTIGDGVYGFTLDPSVGEFFLSHPQIMCPERGKYYSINEGNYNFWDDNIRRYIDWVKGVDKSDGRPMSGRYIGTLVADMHRNLISGGIFLYPKDNRDPKKSTGKLRLLYEASPMAFIIEQAGGRAITGDGREISEIDPEMLHQRVPLIIGSKYDVDMVEEFLTGKR